MLIFVLLKIKPLKKDKNSYNKIVKKIIYKILFKMRKKEKVMMWNYQIFGNQTKLSKTLLKSVRVENSAIDTTNFNKSF